MKEKTTSWGMYPQIDANIYTPASATNLKNIIGSDIQLIPRGNGRSYGDSSLAENMVSSKYRDHLIQLDTENSKIKVQSGVTLDFLFRFLIPRGFFLPVVPGTKYITIGGAVASDIHGKNHHKEGTFTDHVHSLSIINANGEKTICSRTTNSDLFLATCGGMGLTGFIDEVEFSLRKISSNRIHQITHRAKNLDDLFDLFEQYQDTTYTVAWIDSTSANQNMGRGIMMAGEHEPEGTLEYRNSNLPFSIPRTPQWILNSRTVGSFNDLYYHSHFKKINARHVSLDSFFFPLDKLKNWNRLYGKNGFTQYQFVLPRENGREGIRQILQKITKEKTASFLAVLKLFGKQNENYLSFPIEGYTLALDFKITPQIFTFLHQLNEMVISYGGKVYLSKDVCMTRDHFEKMYGEKIVHFKNIREKFKASKFQSLQSRRLGL